MEGGGREGGRRRERESTSSWTIIILVTRIMSLSAVILKVQLALNTRFSIYRIVDLVTILHSRHKFWSVITFTHRHT